MHALKIICLKFTENKAECPDEVSENWPKSHCYGPCQPESLILHCTPDALWDTGNNHSRQGWGSQEQWPQVSEETLQHRDPRGQPEPPGRGGKVHVLQRCGTKGSPGT